MKKLTKKCPRCNTVKKHSLFYKAASRKDGIQSMCKACTKAYQQLPKNKQYHLEYQRQESAKEYKRQFYQTPPARFSLYKRSAKKRGHSFELTFEEFMTFWQKPCHYCGASIDTIGLDQIIPGDGYKITNVRPCCWACNRMKFNRSEKEFLKHLERLIEYRTR